MLGTQKKVTFFLKKSKKPAKKKTQTVVFVFAGKSTKKGKRNVAIESAIGS